MAAQLPDGWIVEKYARPASSYKGSPGMRWAIISPDAMRFGGFMTRKEAIARAIEYAARGK